MDQEVKHLPCKGEVLSSNSSAFGVVFNTKGHLDFLLSFINFLGASHSNQVSNQVESSNDVQEYN
jgi:hypothetical protein